MKRPANKWRSAFGILSVVLAVLFIVRGVWKDERHYPLIDRSELTLQEAPADGAPPTYRQIAPDEPASMVLGQELPTIVIDASALRASLEGAEVRSEPDTETGTDVLRWSNDEGWLEFAFTAESSGWYELEIDYRPLPGSFASIMRGIAIDGRYPFEEARKLELDKFWRDAQQPYARNEIGHEIRPVQTELEGWRTQVVADYSVSSTPLYWYLEAGEHTLRLIGEREPVALKQLRFVAPRTIPTYAEYAAEATDNGVQQNWYALIEAERFSAKSKTGIQTASHSEPYMSPDPRGRIVYNVLGGDRWRTAGEWVEWELEVPETGKYALDLKYLQTFKGQSKSYRTIMIDGQTPFRELLHYALPDNSQFRIHTLQNESGEPYLFQLEKGKHTIRLIADTTPMQPAITALQQLLRELAAFDREIRQVTGNYGYSGANVDLNRTWDLKIYFPDFEQRLEEMMTRLGKIAAYVNGLNGKRTDATTAIAVAEATLRELLEEADEIPNRLGEFSKIQSSLGGWIRHLGEQPLMLDYLVVRAPEAEPELKEASIWSSIPYSAINFARTFYLDYDTKALNEDEAITIWVQRGRDYVDLMKEMIDQQFTPQTGIRVNLNLMPNPNALILGNAAGDQPDLAMGLSTELAVDYAMRGAAADLSNFPGFERVLERFNPGMMRSFGYAGGTYGLPDVQNFYVMYYRADILERLGLTPPDTWDDVYKMLPTLQENGQTFFYVPKEFALLFYQHGAEFYTEDGMDSALDSHESLDAFGHWTRLFTDYYLPRDIPAFFEHFRLGDLPIGISDFSTYVQLTVAAPDITGQWKIAPLPGIRQSDGTIARWAMQPGNGSMILEKSAKKKQAWTFLEWWTSTEVQRQYGQDIESYYGIEYRWNSANKEALLDLPWPREDLQVIAEQSQWAKNMPYVPGYYYLYREMDFAWNRTILDHIPQKEALEEAHFSLQREMKRKQDDLGLSPGTELGLPNDRNRDNRGGKQP